MTQRAICSVVALAWGCAGDDPHPSASASSDASDASEAGTSGTAATAASTAADGSAASTRSSDDTGGADGSGEGSADEEGTESGDTEPTTPDGAWQPLAPLAGGPRQETGVAAVGGEIFVIGGITPEGMVARVEAYDPRTDAWRATADFPDAEVHHANAAGVGDRLWVAGFLSGAGFVAHGEVFAYDPDDDQWIAHPPMPAGTERGAAGVAVLGESVYVLGGSRGGPAVVDASVFDTSTGTWTALPDLPTPRDHLVAAAVDGRIYAIGGRNANIVGHVPRVDVLEVDGDGWSEGPPMPTSRGGMAAAVVGRFIFVAGGEGNPNDPNGVFAELEVLDTETQTWSALDPMPTPRHGTGAAAIGGVVFVPGGADQQQLGAVATHEAWVL